FHWIAQMKDNGIALIIVSNNTADRVAKFASLLNLDFIATSQKPLSKGIKNAINQVAKEKKNVAIVGDQLFTDILGGNLFGCRTILVKPIELEQQTFFKMKRKVEGFLLKNKKTKR
ncbi:MAG: YqeG family HAD IIIA-type phosphatase, partial [Oscillospiraceae bacterium]